MLNNSDIALDASGILIDLNNSFSSLKYSNNIWKKPMLI